MQGGVESLIFLGFLIAIFYFLLIRPQKRRVAQHRELVESVGLGDTIVTIGGIYGTVAALREEQIELEIAPGTRIRLAKHAVARRLTDETEPAGADGATEQPTDRAGDDV